MSFLNELKRRNVFRVGAAYVVMAWLIIQVVETIFPVYGFSDGAIRLVITILAIGLMPVVILAWAFELTPEGLKKDKDVDRSQSIPLQTGKKLDRTIMLVLALALGYFAFDKFVLDPSRDLEMAKEVAVQARANALTESFGDHSIAVLAFSDMSQKGDQEYLSDGIAEELLNLLAKIPDLRVISRSSAFSLKGKDIDIPTVAKQLNVAHVLEGSVRKTGNRIRITAQLIEARTDTHLWSETYDRTLDDIFAIQDEISADVVKQLKITLLSPVPKTRKTDPEAFRLYLQATHITNQMGPGDNVQAELFFRQTLQIDPNFAPAWRELSRVLWRQIGTGPSLRVDIQRSQEPLDRALAIDPDDAAALAYKAWQIMDFDADIARSAALFEQAISLDPANENVIRTAVIFAGAIGRPEVAVTLGEYGITRNALCYRCFRNLAIAYRNANRLDEAETLNRTIQKIFGSNDEALGVVLLLKGQPEAALESFSRIENNQLRAIYTGMVNHALGQSGNSTAQMTTLLENSAEKLPWTVAQAYAWIGRIDEAFGSLNEAANQMRLNDKESDVARDRVTISVNSRNPIFSQLHNDPRWQAFLELYGVSDGQLANVQFNVELPKQ